jgi:hypothetical protein
VAAPLRKSPGSAASVQVLCIGAIALKQGFVKLLLPTVDFLI